VPAPLAAAGASAAGAAARSPAGRRFLVWLAGAGGIVLLFMALAIGSLFGGLNLGGGGGSNGPSANALADIPGNYLRLYMAAGERYGIDWAILAGIGSVETDHGRLDALGVRSEVNAFGCCAGPMQFNITNGIPTTWDAYKVDGNRDGRFDVYDPADAIPAAARLLVANGAPGDYHRAIFAYNHAEWYVQDVLAKASRYRGALRDAGGQLGRLQAGRANAAAVLRNPRIQLTSIQRADLASGAIDPRLTGILAALGREHTLFITALKSDHKPGTNHQAGRAADIGMVDGVRCDGSRQGPCAQVVRELASIEGEMRPTELIYAWDPDRADRRDFADPVDHSDHIHIGWDG
jgi:hypothetical protein